MNPFLGSHFLPYCIKEQPDGSLILLNRAYKPLGFCVEYAPRVRYEDYPINFRTERPLDWVARKLGCAVQEGAGDRFIFLYDSNTMPICPCRGFIKGNWSGYTQKLAALASLRVIKPSEQNTMAATLTYEDLLRKSAEADARFAATGAFAPSSAPLSFEDLA